MECSSQRQREPQRGMQLFLWEGCFFGFWILYPSWVHLNLPKICFLDSRGQLPHFPFLFPKLTSSKQPTRAVSEMPSGLSGSTMLPYTLFACLFMLAVWSPLFSHILHGKNAQVVSLEADVILESCSHSLSKGLNHISVTTFTMNNCKPPAWHQ